MQSSEQFTSALKNLTEGNLEYSAPDLWKSEWLEKAAASFKQGVDWQLGGMGTAPKFFHTMMFRFLLRYAKKNDDQESRKAVTLMLRALAWGGIRDHLGGGFHRYSTDREWLVPHFEKMLYDNALISELYLEAFQATRNSEFATVARETLDYVVNEMTDPGGGFYSTQDADSEGVEGKFYTWSSEEISDALESPWRERFCEYYSVSQSGNWAGTNILHLRQELGSFVKNWDVDVVVAERELALCRRKLLELRQKRVAPLRDEKILVAWNGMMITSFAKAYQVLGDESYLNAAKKAANFVIDKLWEAQERPGLSHSCKDREPKGNGFLDDYTHFMNGLLSLYEADFDQKWIDWAKKLADFVSENFWDEESQSFYYTPKFHEKLIVKTRDIHDGATPSANSMAAHVFHHLGRMTGVDDYRKKAELSVGGLSQFMETQVTAISQLVLTLDDHLSSFREIVVTQGDGREELLGALREMYLPNTLILSTGEGDHLPLLAGKEPDGTNAQVYVCQGQSCSAPVSEVAKLQGLLQ